MKFSHFFIDRPRFAVVISIFIMLVGAISFFSLPVAQYPAIVPPMVSVSARYAGASPEVAMMTVATPIEEKLNGVENMIYMQSQCGNDGQIRINVTFETGVDPELARIRVQSRVDDALSQLPQEVRNVGVSVRKRSPDIILTASLISPNGTRDKLYLTNYAITQMQDRLARIYGIGDFIIFGAKEFSMRIWMDPERMSAYGISPSDVIARLREQNKQVAAGKLNEAPHKTGAAYELILNAQGRLQTVDEFGDIIVKYLPDGRMVRLRDVAEVELGSYSYGNESYLNGQSSVSMGFYQLPEANALETAARVKDMMAEMKKSFPPDMDYVWGYDATEYISESVNAIYRTILEAVLLVVIVVMVFLQNWRAALIPLFAIPVSIIGTFAIMVAFGFSVNNLTLFGLVLAIGIVVDDAIVVVENVERNMREGLKVREATKSAMTQIQGALVAIVLVLSSVFIPTAFLSGISGQFYKQFAITIAASTIISGIVSLTLMPALCAVWLKDEDEKPDFFTRLWNLTFGRIFGIFNKYFDWFSAKYGAFVARSLRFSIIMFVCYVGLLGLTKHLFDITPKGFIPRQDMGSFNISVQLPDGAAFDRTDALAKEISALMQHEPGVTFSMAIAGINATAGGARASNTARISLKLDDRRERDAKGLGASVIAARVREILDNEVIGATCNIMMPPAVTGIGVGGDFKFMVQDRIGLGLQAVEKYSILMAEEASKLPEISSAFTSYRLSNPQLYLDIDRKRAQKLNVPLENIFTALQYNLGSLYVNDFNLLGRVYKVVAQANVDARANLEDIYNIKVSNTSGEKIQLGSLVEAKRVLGPDRAVRYNTYPCADIQGNCAPGYSTGQAIAAIERLSKEILPDGMGIEWTDLSYQEMQTKNTAMLIFALSVIFVFLLLVALYESWSLPLAVILIVPLVLLFAVAGVLYRGMDNNIMTQIGFVVLIGLACKNAILIVEFAHQREAKGQDLVFAVSQAAKNRLRPIIMTSLAFIFGVIPLAYGTGAGMELRQALGTSVFFGMIGVTVFGCIFTPVFYYLIRHYFVRKNDSERT